MRAITIALLTATSIAFAAPRVMHSQGGCQACISSSSCSVSTTRSGCTWLCQGSQGMCACGDGECSPTLARFPGLGATYNGPGLAQPISVGTYAILSCVGDIHGVSYTREKAREMVAALEQIALQQYGRGPVLRVSHDTTVYRYGQEAGPRAAYRDGRSERSAPSATGSFLQ